MDIHLPPALEDGVTQVLGNIAEARPVTQHGYTPTRRWIVTFDHGVSLLFWRWEFVCYSRTCYAAIARAARTLDLPPPA